MGWRFSWRLHVESDRKPEEKPWPALLRWAVVGFAIVGIAGVLFAKGILS